MTKRLIILAAWALVLPLRSRADDVSPCVAGSLASVLGATCTIGDKTFGFLPELADSRIVSFFDDTSTTTQIKADVFGFAPDTSNPDSPGFTISLGSLSSLSSEAGVLKYLLFELQYGVSLTDPSSSAVIVGATATTIGASVTPSDPTFSATYLSAGVGNLLSAFVGPTLCSADAIAQTTLQNGVSSSTPSSTVDTFSPQPECQASITAAGGEATLGYELDGGSATLMKAGFYVDEGTPSAPTNMPEPSTIAFLGAGIICLSIWRRRATLIRLFLQQR